MIDRMIRSISVTIGKIINSFESIHTRRFVRGLILGGGVLSLPLIFVGLLAYAPILGAIMFVAPILYFFGMIWEPDDEDNY